MERITLTQAMRLLEVNNHRFKQLLEKTGILPEASRSDRKSKLITMEQLEQLRLAYIGQRRTSITRQESANMDGNSVIATMLIRIETLERQVALLSKKAAPPQSARPIEGLKPPQAQQIGIGKRNAATLATQHGANSWKSAMDWYWQESDLVDELAALRFIKVYLGGHRAGTWHVCTTPDCGCQRV